MKQFLFFLTIFCLVSCEQDKGPDTIIYNAEIYLVRPQNQWVEALSIKNGKIFGLGKSLDLLKQKDDHTTLIDAHGSFLIPGFIEGHGHFSGMGKMLMNLNFLKSKSWASIIEEVKEKAKTLPKGTWIEGRGWHQEKWDSLAVQSINGYPTHDEMSTHTHDYPVILYHASGHALFANEKAMEIANVTKETKDPEGGHIVRNFDGAATGVFEERAMGLIYDAYQNYIKGLSADEQDEKWNEAIVLAQQKCLENGITSFQDAGSKFFELDRYAQMAKSGNFDIRLWAMARHNSQELSKHIKDHIKVNVGNGFFTCNAIKTELDGALGSFGAWLLEPYSDKAGFTGQNTTTTEEVRSIAAIAKENGMQLCIHAIGDRANRESIDIFKSFNPENKDLRWRIEHAQHIHPDDIPRMVENNIIASMQGIHCTSDAPFVVKRLGYERAKNGAYAWKSIINQGGIIANGTDVPVEDIDPIACYYASVTRKRADTGFEFFPEQRMTRIEALESYTINNAYAVFQENEKGSIEIGKYADISSLSQNLIKCPEEKILETEVLWTMVNGQIKYRKQ